MIIHAIHAIQSNLSISLGGEDFYSLCFWLPWQSEFCMDLLHLSNFDKRTIQGLFM